MRRLHIFVQGRVQGVAFREATRRQATALGVSGWVRNLLDGRVEAVYEGEPEAVSRLLTWTWSGPPQARVSDVQIEEEAPLAERGFRILQNRE